MLCTNWGLLFFHLPKMLKKKMTPWNRIDSTKKQATVSFWSRQWIYIGLLFWCDKDHLKVIRSYLIIKMHELGPLQCFTPLLDQFQFSRRYLFWEGGFDLFLTLSQFIGNYSKAGVFFLIATVLQNLWAGCLSAGKNCCLPALELISAITFHPTEI